MWPSTRWDRRPIVPIDGASPVRALSRWYVGQSSPVIGRALVEGVAVSVRSGGAGPDGVPVHAPDARVSSSITAHAVQRRVRTGIGATSRAGAAAAASFQFARKNSREMTDTTV